MKKNNDIKLMTYSDLDKLHKFIAIIDPKKKVFGVTNTIVCEKKKIKLHKKEINK